MKVEVFDQDGNNIESTGEPGELVCSRPHPSLPLKFWGDESGQRLREAYFGVYPGTSSFLHPQIVLYIKLIAADYRYLAARRLYGCQSSNKGNTRPWSQVDHFLPTIKSSSDTFWSVMAS